MNWKVIANILVVLFLLVGVFGNYLNTPKTAYINTYEVFEGFDGKKDLQKKLETEVLYKKNVLDSLQIQIKAIQESKQPDQTTLQTLVIRYKTLDEQFQADYQKQNAEYTESASKQINEYTKLYAEQKGYDYIFGAAGNGSLMYGSPRYDITQDLIKYINEKYAGK